MTHVNNERHDPDCIFCKIARGELDTEFVYQNDRIAAFKDMNPQAKHHVLIVPINHYADISELAQASTDNGDAQEDWQALLDSIPFVANELDVGSEGYRIINNCGAGAGQSVFHLHVHFLSDEKLAERLV